MDTRFWGPYGWEFLHSIPLKYDSKNEANKKIYFSFFKLLGEMLPCKYCRQSYKKYFKELDIRKYLSSKERLFRWTYELHNKVNDKLRFQGFLTDENPELNEVRERFDYISEHNRIKKTVAGIEFIYIIAFHHKNSNISNKDKKYKRFFKLLSYVFPIQEVRPCLQSMIKKDFKFEKCGMLRWWHNTYKKALERCDFVCDVCIKTCRDKCEAHISSCKRKNHKGKTCRKIKKGRVGKARTMRKRRD